MSAYLKDELISAHQRQLLPAMSLEVDTLADESNGDYSSGDLSLREAIGLANGSVASEDIITFAATLTAAGPGTIRLTHRELRILDSVSINGPGALLLSIDASASDPTPDVNDGNGSRVFNIDDGVYFGSPIEVSVSGLTLTGGDIRGPFGGGAILNRENLNVSRQHDHRQLG